MARIDPPQQLSLVEAERERVIRLPRAGLPLRLLTSHHHGQAIEVGHHAAIDRLVEREESRLVRQQLPHCDAPLSLLRELGPVRGDPFFVVEPTARVRQCQGHGGQALGG